MTRRNGTIGRTGRLAAAAAVLMLAAACGDSSGTKSVGLAPDVGTSAIVAGSVTFKNSCAVPLSFHSSGPAVRKLEKGGDSVSIPIVQFNQNDQNVIIPYPDTGDAQCPAAFCDGWTALGGAPGTVQREGSMWDSPNDVYAAYCNPNLSGRSICAQQMNCCGPGMVQDGTFGTLWEFTPAGSGGNDYPDLSTDYGTGPTTPPNLCPTGAPNNCVSAAANIFFNVPIQWTTNQPCSFTSANTQVTGLQCFTADCSDAYQYPIDDKQCSCPSSAQRGYLVEYCPAGSSMPATPG